jgi:phosphoesterase RecJ-like protein
MNQLLEMLHQHNPQKILILPHVSPDGDTIGSAIGLMHLLAAKGIKGYIVSNDDIPSNLSFLSEKCPADAFINAEAVDFTYDMVIAVDCAEPKLFQDREMLCKEGIPLISIDHHFTNQHYADYNLVDVEASSTGEMIYSLFVAWHLPLNALAAEALYTAIVTDTGSFRYSNTRPYTFEACAALHAQSFDFNTLNVSLFQNKSFEKLHLQNKIFETLERYCDGKVAIVTFSLALKNSLAYDTYDTDGVVEYIRDISGVEVVAFLKEVDHGGVKGSLRAKYNFDVSNIAQQFGGGGHIKAAGFTINEPLDKTKQMLIETITKHCKGD